MATILEENTIIYQLLQPSMEEPTPLTIEELDDFKMSLWIKEKSIIRASPELIVQKILDPGVYTVDFDRDLGYYCSPIEVVTDELFIFSTSITQNLLEEINLFWAKADLYKENNLVHKRGILLEGFPGVGKSSIITQLANEVIKQKGVVFKISNFKNLDNYITFMRTGFRKIQPNTPIITILEDIDKYREVEPELLDFLDGKSHLNHHIVIATTNNTQDIPNTFLRPSRLDMRIEITKPDSQTRREYFQFKHVPEDLIEELVLKSADRSLADLKELYICIFLLDYSMEAAILKVTAPKAKKSYIFSNSEGKKIGLTNNT